MDFAMMFNVLEGGVVDPIPWSKDAFEPNRSIIILDEGSMSLYLWHGVQQGLVARRTALRQAESLKGHGYTVGKSIIGRDIKAIKEIDSRKVGRVPEETAMNDELQAILNRDFKELDNQIVTFSVGEYEATMAAKEEPKPAKAAAPKVEPKPELKPAAPAPKPAAPAPAPEPKPATAPAAAPASAAPSSSTKTLSFASEYDMGNDLPSIQESKAASAAAAAPAPEPVKPEAESPEDAAKTAFVIKAVLDNFDDIWVSKKPDGNISIEQMDGPVCSFTVEAGKIKFSTNSFTSVDPSIKTKIQNVFIDLSKLL